MGLLGSAWNSQTFIAALWFKTFDTFSFFRKFRDSQSYIITGKKIGPGRGGIVFEKLTSLSFIIFESPSSALFSSTLSLAEFNL